ncbi:MAG: protein translocase subunit SecD [Corynebacterium sp.]|nr:protein translocase subunit SecD [Corynebacterium sp.]
MASKQRSGGSQWETWPKRAIAVFGLLIIVIYAFIFLTGDRSATPRLGIDLQGGTRITLVPQGAQPTQEQLQQAKLILENRVNGMGVSGANVVADGDSLVITVPGEDTSQARAVGQTSQLLFRPVIQPNAAVDDDTVIKALEAMGNRWVETGAMPAAAVQQKFDQVRQTFEDQKKKQEESAQQGKVTQEIKVPELKLTVKEPKEAADSIAATKQRNEQLKVLKDDRQSDDASKQIAASTLMVCDNAPDALQGSDDPKKPLVACDSDTGQVLILGEVPLLVGETDLVNGKRLTGNEIDSGRPITGGPNSQTGEMEISFAFKAGDGDKGSETWSKLTQEYLQQQVAITLDSKIISAPQIRQATGVGQATSITGNFTQKQATEFANNLRYGALPLSFAGENGESGGTAITVPASLGVASLKAGLIAGVVGFGLVALFSLFFYRVFGLISLVALVLAEVLVYGALVLLGRQIGYSLDLAGIAGLIIGIGATADSFVVLYERIKDEIRHGRTFRSAVPHAWNRAKQTILTGNFVTLIASVVVYFLAVGEVKGFAFTLGLTTVFDLLVTYLLTAPLVILASRKRWAAKPALNGLGKVFKLVKEKGAAPPENGPAVAKDDAAKSSTESFEEVEHRLAKISVALADPDDDDDDGEQEPPTADATKEEK